LPLPAPARGCFDEAAGGAQLVSNGLDAAPDTLRRRRRVRVTVLSEGTRSVKRVSVNAGRFVVRLRTSSSTVAAVFALAVGSGQRA
jgi:hypothetical protein